jgi:hypothetical protein
MRIRDLGSKRFIPNLQKELAWTANKRRTEQTATALMNLAPGRAFAAIAFVII